jgi:uncharacterized protein
MKINRIIAGFTVWLIATGAVADTVDWTALPDWMVVTGQEEGAPVPLLEEPPAEPFALLGASVLAGDFVRLPWRDQQSFTGLDVAVPVLVVHGVRPGPVLCVTAAIHGDELNGIEIVRNLMFGINPATLNGTVVGVPIVNIHGFQRRSRYLPDRRDLNRHFPGNSTGSAASRIAHSFFQSVVRHCDFLVDLHTGSLLRTNVPQLRADLNNEAVKAMTAGFGATVVLHSRGGEGTLRRAATDVGIPAVTLEAGEPMRFQPDEVSHGVRSLRSLMNHLGMDSRAQFWKEPRPIYYRSSWVRADSSGILSNRVALGDLVEQGDLLGTITDPITNLRADIRSPFRGRILGKALGQAVMPGYALYHIGIAAPDVDPLMPCPDLEALSESDCPSPMLLHPEEFEGHEGTQGNNPEHGFELEDHGLPED